MSWRLSARCAGADSELFFDRDRTSEAKTFCAECPVAAFCLQAALKAEGKAGRNNRHGVCGGKTPLERYRIATGRPTPRRRCQDCGTPLGQTQGGRQYCDTCRTDRIKESARQCRARKKETV